MTRLRPDQASGSSSSKPPSAAERTRTVLDDWERLARPLWEQMPHEGERHFDWFTLYCTMGKSRSTSKVAGQLPEVRTTTTVEQTAAKYAWHRRAQAYDEFMLGATSPRLLDRLQTVDAAPLMRHSWSMRRRDLRERKYVIGKVFTDLVHNRLLATMGMRWDDELQQPVPTGEEPLPLKIPDQALPAFARLGMTMMTEAAYESVPQVELVQSVDALEGGAEDDEPVELPRNLLEADDHKIKQAIEKLRAGGTGARTHTRQ